MIVRHEKPVGRPCSHRLYELSCDEFEVLRKRAGDRCEICGIRADESAHRVLHIDHDAPLGHKAVRGLLCGRCNTGLELDTVVPPEKRHAYKANAFHLSLHDKWQRRAHEEAFRQQHIENLITLSDPYRQATQALDAARKALTEAVRDAHRDEVRQVDILKATDHVWTREQVRRVVAGTAKPE